MGLGSLKDKLLDAGLVTEEQVKAAEEAARKARKGRRGKGKRRGPRSGDGTEAPAEDLSPEERAAAEAKREARERAKALERERRENRRRAKQEMAIRAKVVELVDADRIDPEREAEGADTFFFLDRKKRIQRMIVGPAVRARLEAGEIAIVERPLPHEIGFALVSAKTAEKIGILQRKCVRFFNSGDYAAPEPAAPHDRAAPADSGAAPATASAEDSPEATRHSGIDEGGGSSSHPGNEAS